MSLRFYTSGWMALGMLLLAAGFADAQTQTPLPLQGAPPKPGQTAPLVPGQTAPGQAPSASKPGKVEAGAPTPTAVSDQPAPGTGAGVLVDQVIAVINGDLVLESDVEEEHRFEAFQPFSSVDPPATRQTEIERLVDRALILQQAKLQPENSVTTEEAVAQLKKVQAEIPACKQYHCETEAGWAKFCNAQGFTVAEVTERWRQRMQLLKFVEERFQMGVQITPAEIKEYYAKTLLPEFARRKVTPPKFEAISDQIREVLLQKRVTALLDDWLRSLKAQGSVRIMKPEESQ